MTSIHVHASTLAGLVGRHPHVKQYEAFETLWSRVDACTFIEAHVRNNLQTPAQRKHERSANVVEIVHAAIISGGRTYTSLASNVDPETRRDVQEAIFTRHGIDRESEVLSTVRRITNLDIVRDNAYRKKYIGTLRDGTSHVFIGGRVDGLTRCGRVIVEVKSRVHKLFMSPLEYERIQVQAYLALFPRASHAILAESMAESAINIMKIERDDALWTELVAQTMRLLNCLMHMVRDRDLQDSYLRSKQRRAFLQRYLTDNN